MDLNGSQNPIFTANSTSKRTIPKMSTKTYVSTLLWAQVLNVLDEFKMYDDAMEAIHTYLIQKSMGNKMTYTSELVPENGPDGEL